MPRMAGGAVNCDLVLEGGGVKGIALVGAVDVLEEHGYRVQRVAGTSAGAIVGALVAAGLTREERRDLMLSIDYSRFQDRSFVDRLPGGRLLSLLVQLGMYEGDYLRTWLSEVLSARGITTFADLRCDDDAASSSSAYPSRLTVMASDITHGKLRCLPTDYPALGCDDPGAVAVVDAVRASMSIPFFYEPVRLPGRDGKKITLVDGGMLSNFPVAVFDRKDGQVPRWPTFGIKLSAHAGDQARRFEAEGLMSMVKAMIGTMTSFYDQIHLDEPSTLARTIFVDTFGVKATEFDLDDTTRDTLYANGRTAAEKFLQSWDFQEYVATYRSAAVPRQSTPPLESVLAPVPPQATT
jgi:NTE family protein